MVLTTQGGIAGIGLGHLLGRERDSNPQSGSLIKTGSVCNTSMSGAATLGDCGRSSLRVRGRNCSIDVCRRSAWKEAVWCTSAPDSLEAKIEVDDTVITRTRRDRGFKTLGVWITFDGHFVKELAKREVIVWRSFFAKQKLLCDDKTALRHQLPVLVFWQLDFDSVTMHPLASNPRQDVETNDIRTQVHPLKHLKHT